METKYIKVGDYIRGFKFGYGFHSRMTEYIGKLGRVKNIHGNYIDVEFEDNFEWRYPKDLAIKHLCTQDIIDFEKGLDANAKDPLKDTPFHKPDFSHLLDVDKVLEKGIKNSGLNQIPIEELEAHFKDEPKLFSVLLTKENESRVYTNLDIIQVEVKVNKYSDYHSIIVEQVQDKGIQVLIKS